MKLLLLILLILVCLLQVSETLAIDANTTDNIVHHDSQRDSSPSTWLKGVTDQEWRRNRTGCRGRPWVCNPRGQGPRTKRCCDNRCIDVYSDVNHCGLCWRRCRFGRQCCGRRCVNVRFSRRHCGRCFNRCPRESRCKMGMCGYADDAYMLSTMEPPSLPDSPQLDQLPPQLDENENPEPDIAGEDL